MTLPEPFYSRDGIQLFLGDALDILPLIAPETVDLVLTDPPYGIALQEHGRNGYDWSVIGDKDQSIGEDALAVFRERDWPMIVFASPQKPWSGKWRQHLVWDKGPAVGGGGDIATCWKFTWDLIQTWNTGVLNGRRDAAVLRYWVGQADFHDHPCQKPVALLSYLIDKASRPGDCILDPFAGSGSTLRAAKNLGRRAIGVEISEEYCQIAVRRLSQSVMNFEAVTA